MNDIMLPKIRTILAESSSHLSAKQIAEKCHMSVSAVYTCIRKMRIANIGILTTNKGYILAECASKKDDVNFMRRLYARRTSDFISMKAAQPHIESRWSSNPEDLKTMTKPLLVNLSGTKGMKFLLSCDK